ncbi:NAD(P)-binding protein [Dothidotthia symphoricarpi CBS 119687]|uniref:NAD(P)-binding protein n=1 Tax=Dothidotthia symphoricarpi CBS 119687 TaxID=1392245 RepID=A0A6A6A3G4_9PLEO|nr:NAD(P)-binding protein [Dothidotthia symphoricarpi CBS 119687]KAF2125298.1 NAD(P)-binding protein [Dothidotthia symphoricarpi CBS 119687]
MPGQRLLNRIAIVTGASQGIGREVCNQFFEEGALLVCADIRPLGQGETLSTHEWMAQKGGKAIFFRMDVGSADDWKALIAKTVEEYGRLDIIVNNAAICLEASNPQPIDEVDEDAFDAHMRVNARGVFLGSKYAVKQFKTQEPQPCGVRGWIVNFASMVSHMGMQGLTGYTASKGAVAAMTKTIALDVAKQGIVANCICPGFSQTAMLENALGSVGALSVAAEAVKSSIPRGLFGETIDHGRAAVYLASDDAKWVTGISLNVDGGISAQ